MKDLSLSAKKYDDCISETNNYQKYGHQHNKYY